MDQTASQRKKGRARRPALSNHAGGSDQPSAQTWLLGHPALPPGAGPHVKVRSLVASSRVIVNVLLVFGEVTVSVQPLLFVPAAAALLMYGRVVLAASLSDGSITANLVAVTLVYTPALSVAYVSIAVSAVRACSFALASYAFSRWLK